jgi:hypothetical protein
MAMVLLAGAARAEGPQDRYWAELEYFFPTISSTARLDFPGTQLPGTAVSLEDEMGLSDRKGTPYLLLGMRLGESWRLEFEYYELNRSATRRIGREIHWGDITFPVSADITTQFDSSIYRLVGGWSFYRTPQAEAGAALGLHLTDFRMSMAGQGNGPAGLSFQSEKRDQLVPLPTLGLYGSYALAESWVVRGRVDWLSLDYENYKGSLTNWLVAVDWRFVKNWARASGTASSTTRWSRTRRTSMARSTTASRGRPSTSKRVLSGGSDSRTPQFLGE